jgi:hypothetical protein
MDHKLLAIECFNNIWKILDNPTPTKDEISNAIRLAHTSTWHWAQVGTALHQQRGEWICARVYTQYGMYESALYHADRCMTLAIDNDLKDFDFAYAFEAFARIYALMKNTSLATAYMDKAKAAGALISKPEDRAWFEKDLETIK